MKSNIRSILAKSESNIALLNLDDSKISLTEKIEKVTVEEQIEIVKWLTANGEFNFENINKKENGIHHCILETKAFSINLGVIDIVENIVKDKSSRVVTPGGAALQYYAKYRITMNFKKQEETRFRRKDGTLLSLAFFFKDHKNKQYHDINKKYFKDLEKEILRYEFMNQCKS